MKTESQSSEHGAPNGEPCAPSTRSTSSTASTASTPSTPSAPPPLGWPIYAGLFMVTLATLMFEILLTRIFSVTTWYHFAFMAISIAMFGMTAGALAVYLCPSFFAPARTRFLMALSAFLFALAMIFALMTHLTLLFMPTKSLMGLYSIALNYLVISTPFFFSGICVCLALTRYPAHVGRLYAADLAGAAVGCVALIYTLEITDGLTAVFVIALFAMIGCFLFAMGDGMKKTRMSALVCAALIVLFVAVNTYRSTYSQHGLRNSLKITWAKGAVEFPVLYTRWNCFSRIAVYDYPNSHKPFGWGLTPKYQPDRPLRQMGLNFDGAAASVLTGFDGDLKGLEHLKYDITNLAHHLRPESDVLVVGAGGGRDVLAALAFRQKFVTAVEINGAVMDVVNRIYGDYTGHLDRRPDTRFIVDEARSYIARMKEPKDLIQISLIDTFAATAAGAFVLTENSLYTTEAWKTFLTKLTPRGVLSVTHWYVESDPAIMLRLTGLAAASLEARGVTDPRRHILVARIMKTANEYIPDGTGLGTILVSPSPFSDDDINNLWATCRTMGFDVVLEPKTKTSLNDTFAALTSGKDIAPVCARYPVNIAPPTDDNPFFFHMLRFRDILRFDPNQSVIMATNYKAVGLLGTLLLIVIVLTGLCIGGPLLMKSKTGARGVGGVGGMDGVDDVDDVDGVDNEAGAGCPVPGAPACRTPLLLFFALIGMGFMMIELSQMQRLIIFLGHPTYGLSVVLFTLLLSSGLGSYLTPLIKNPNKGLFWILILLATLIVFGAATPYAIGAWHSAETWLRIAVAVLILFPLGILMGMMFPLGMRLAAANAPGLTPWLWGVNGATSVCASVLATAIALGAGISVAFWVGAVCYASAGVAYRRASLR